MTESALYDLERAAIGRFAVTHPEIAEMLGHQLERAVVTERWNTGVGFFTSIAVSQPCTRIETLDTVSSSVYRFTVEGLELGMGFVVYIEDGYLDGLEGFAEIGSTTDIDFATVGFSFLPSGD